MKPKNVFKNEYFSKKVQNEFKNFEDLKQEVKFGENTRFDFLVSNKMQRSFIEVKNVTL